MASIQEKLFASRDEKYALFSAKLTPSINCESFIGVRMPIIRALAKEIKNEPQTKEFLKQLPHKYYEENILHSVLLINVKDFDECVNDVDTFLPYIDNWAVCDTLRPKCFNKHQKELFAYINKWIVSDKEYTIRFAIDCLMSNYLDEHYQKAHLEMVGEVKDERYYVQMMQAWYYATAMIEHWDDIIEYFNQNKLSKWVHNKSIQKAIESYRISDCQKEYLRMLKR